MSFVEDKFNQFGGFVEGSLLGGDVADASVEAGRIQQQSTEAGIAELRAALGPLADTLSQSLPELLGFTLDPNKQADFALNNPLIQGMQDQTFQRILSNQAARGKAGSGGTIEAAQNALIPIGLQQVQQRQNNLLNLTQLGAGAAQTQGVGISDLLGSGGAARAAGVVGSATAKGQGVSNLLNLGGTLGSAALLSDENTKENITLINTLPDGVNIYAYNYIGDDEVHMGVLAQEIEEIYPDAVMEVDGIKLVDYEVILNAH